VEAAGRSGAPLGRQAGARAHERRSLSAAPPAARRARRPLTPRPRRAQDRQRSAEGGDAGRDELTTAGASFAREVAQLFMAGRRGSVDLGAGGLPRGSLLWRPSDGREREDAPGDLRGDLSAASSFSGGPRPGSASERGGGWAGAAARAGSFTGAERPPLGASPGGLPRAHGLEARPRGRPRAHARAAFQTCQPRPEVSRGRRAHARGRAPPELRPWCCRAMQGARGGVKRPGEAPLPGGPVGTQAAQ